MELGQNIGIKMYIIHQASKQKTSTRELPIECESLYIESLKYYNKLKTNSITV